MEVTWFDSLLKAGPLLDLDLTLNLDHVTEGNMVSSFKYHQRRIISQLPWAVSQRAWPLLLWKDQKMVFIAFNWTINYYNSCPFVLHLSEEPGSTSPSISLSIHLMFFIPFIILVAILWTCLTMSTSFKPWGPKTGHLSPDEVSEASARGTWSLYLNDCK